MDKTMSQPTRTEILQKLRRRYGSAGLEHKGKLLDQAQDLLGYHRKSAIRALRAAPAARGPWIIPGRPLTYEPAVLLPYLRPIWQATDYACGRRLVAMLPEWVPAYEEHERKLPGEVREKLLSASGRTLDRLLEPLRLQGGRHCLRRPGTLLRQQIPIRGSVWEEGQAGWKWTRWPCAGGAWQGNTCGWWTGWITRRRGWKCGRCGDGARRGHWRRCRMWKRVCPLRCWGWTATTGVSF